MVEFADRLGGWMSDDACKTRVLSYMRKPLIFGVSFNV